MKGLNETHIEAIRRRFYIDKDANEIIRDIFVCQYKDTVQIVVRIQHETYRSAVTFMTSYWKEVIRKYITSPMDVPIDITINSSPVAFEAICRGLDMIHFNQQYLLNYFWI